MQAVENINRLFAGTADALMAVDQDGKILYWNDEMAEVFGIERTAALGSPCHAVISGRDPFGNRFCSAHCPVLGMATDAEPVHSYELDVKRDGESLRMRVSIVVLPGDEDHQRLIVHLMSPTSQAGGISTDMPPVPPELAERASHLTKREIEVLGHLAAGRRTADIADLMFISSTTLRSHVQNILRKLDAHSKLEAVVQSIRAGIIRL